MNEKKAFVSGRKETMEDVALFATKLQELGYTIYAFGDTLQFLYQETIFAYDITTYATDALPTLHIVYLNTKDAQYPSSQDNLFIHPFTSQELEIAIYAAHNPETVIICNAPHTAGKKLMNILKNNDTPRKNESVRNEIFCSWSQWPHKVAAIAAIV